MMKVATFIVSFTTAVTLVLAAGLCDNPIDSPVPVRSRVDLTRRNNVASEEVMGVEQGSNTEIRGLRTVRDTETMRQRQHVQQQHQQQQQQPQQQLNRSQALYEERKRREQLQLFSIQQQIWERLGFSAGRPTSRPTNITQAELERFQAAMRRAEESNSRTPERVVHPQEYFAKLYQTLSPICRMPKTQTRIWTDDLVTSFRLYFNIEPSDVTLRQQNLRETKVDVADLLLKRKLLQRPRRWRGTSGTNSTLSSPSTERLYVNVYSYTKPVKANRRDMRRVVSTFTLDRYTTSTAWVRIDLRTVVEDWMLRPGRNNGLQITVSDNDHQAVDPLSVFEHYNCSLAAEARTDRSPVLLNIPSSSRVDENREDDSEELTRDEMSGIPVNYPHLKLVTVEVPKPGSRHRRDGNSGAAGAGRPATCVMEKITVSLDELSLSDVIILPRVFETGYCRGSCPLVGADSSRSLPRGWTVHVTNNVTSLGGLPTYLGGTQSGDDISTASPVTSSLGGSPSAGRVVGTGSDAGIHECCGPTRLKPLNVLQSNDKGLYIATLDDLIITECGCRL